MLALCAELATKFSAAVEKERVRQLVVYLSPGVGYGARPMHPLATPLPGFPAGTLAAQHVQVAEAMAFASALGHFARITPKHSAQDARKYVKVQLTIAANQIDAHNTDHRQKT